MGIFSESDSERSIREHNEGQKAGARATNLDKVVHNLGGDSGRSAAYNAGWDNGIANPEPKRHSRVNSNSRTSKPAGRPSSKRRTKENSSSSGSSTSQESSGLIGCIGPLVLVGIVGYGLYYFASLPIKRYGGPPGPYDLDGVGLQAQPLAWTNKVVNVTNLNIRENPSKEANVVWQAQKGDIIAVSGNPRLVGGELWIKVSVDNGRIQGWASRKMISN